MGNDSIYVATPLKLLIVEDNERHLSDAKEEMQRRIDAGTRVQPFYASDLKSAMDIINGNGQGLCNLDGVISDVFYPTGLNEGEDRDIREKLEGMFLPVWTHQLDISRDIKSWSRGSEIPPSGAYLAFDLIGGNIPVVLCTDGWHHGKKTQPVYSWAQENNVGFVDNNRSEDFPAKKKYWTESYGRLLNMVAQKVAGIPVYSKYDWSSITLKMKEDHDAIVKAYSLQEDVTYPMGRVFLFSNNKT